MYCLLFKVISLFVAFVFLQNICWNVSKKKYLSNQRSIDNKIGFLLSFTESFDRQIRRINSKENRKIISVYEPFCLASSINNSQSDNWGNEHLLSESYEQPNGNSTELLMLINNSNLLPELNVCSIEYLKQFLKDFGNTASLYQQEEESLSWETNLVTEMLVSEEANGIKDYYHGQIEHQDIAMEPQMLLNTLSEEEVMSDVDKFADEGNKTQVTSLDFKLPSSSHAEMFYNSFQFVEKTLNLNYNEEKVLAQQQLKFSLNPELINLGQRFTSKLIFKNDRNDRKECHASNSIVYHLFVDILQNLPNGIYKSLGNQYHLIVEEYDERHRKDNQKPTWKQLVNNVLRNIKLFTRLTNSLIFQIVMYLMTHFSAFIGILMHTGASWLILLIHWVLHIVVITINVIGISPRDLFFLGLFLLLILEIKKYYEKEMEVIIQSFGLTKTPYCDLDVQLHGIQNQLKSKLNEQQAALELLKKQHDRERVRSGNILMEQGKKLKKLAEKIGKQKPDKRIPLPFPTVPIPPPLFVSPDLSQRFKVVGPPPKKKFPNMFPMGINPHPNATEYRPAKSPNQRRFPAGTPSEAFSVPPMPGVAPPLFMPKSSHNHSRYPQHSHAHWFAKEVNPLQYIGCPDNYVPPSSPSKRNA